MRLRIVIVCGLLSLSALLGCERRIPKEQLGTVVFELPKVPGAEKRPPTPDIPDLTPPSTATDSEPPADAAAKP
jgi:hypothetical protein